MIESVCRIQWLPIHQTKFNCGSAPRFDPRASSIRYVDVCRRSMLFCDCVGAISGQVLNLELQKAYDWLQ